MEPATRQFNAEVSPASSDQQRLEGSEELMLSCGEAREFRFSQTARRPGRAEGQRGTEGGRASAYLNACFSIMAASCPLAMLVRRLTLAALVSRLVGVVAPDEAAEAVVRVGTAEEDFVWARRPRCAAAAVCRRVGEAKARSRRPTSMVEEDWVVDLVGSGLEVLDSCGAAATGAGAAAAAPASGSDR
jgi:hypothetical protein